MATFEHLWAFGATFCGSSKVEQSFKQNVGLDHIWSTKNSTVSLKTSRNIWYFRLWECNQAIVLFFVQVATYRSARRQLNRVLHSVRPKSIAKFRRYLRARSNFLDFKQLFSSQVKFFSMIFYEHNLVRRFVSPSVHHDQSVGPSACQSVGQSVSQLVSWPY